MKEIEEVWKPLAPFSVTYKGVTTEYDFSDTYEISNTGKVRSLDRIDCAGRLLEGRERKLIPDKDGYLQLSLSKDRKELNCKVHRLVAQTFLENTENKRTVNHKDGNKTNNNVDNLEWATQSEQIRHSFANGLQVPIRGEQHVSSKLTKSKVVEIRERRATNPKVWTLTMLAKEYGVGRTHISNIIHRKRWTHV